MVIFGPAGNSDSFYAQGYKHSNEVPEYVQKMGLDAFEYQCGRGVRIKTETANILGEEAQKRGISLSVHAPYYISLSSLEADKRENSIDYILQSARAVTDMGGTRIVVHSGSCAKMTREAALALGKETMQRAIQVLDERGYGSVQICPEVMGKINQLGTLEEVLELCSLDERMLPCVDFGHLNARTFGGLRSKADFEAVFDAIENKLGADRMRSFHIHFSKIQYTDPGGEKVHLTFADTVYGPRFEPLAELLAQKNSNSTVICESAGTQAEDAVTMKQMYIQEQEARL